jgi:hypothetical protein
MASNSDTTNLSWWTLDQLVVYILQRVEIPLQDAKQFCNSPELKPEIIDGALNALTNAVVHTIRGVVAGMPITAARILAGRRYVDLAALFQPSLSLETGAWDAVNYEVRQFISQSGVEFNPIWARRMWPAPTQEVETKNAPTATKNAPTAMKNTPTATKNRRGRPSTGNARTGTERSRAWRTARRARSGATKASAQPSVLETDATLTPNAGAAPESSPSAAQQSRLAIADPALSSVPRKRSRKKAVYQSPQMRRARAVLDRLFPDRNYPARTDISWPELWNLFCDEYVRYEKDNLLKLSVKPTKKLPMPSERTVRRALGWE